ncbi:MAG: nucleotidyltransferase domain-containing protein [Anaerolineaceae bacterium]|nr:nucleotidyltransferase domain-containing protein [Anaerolineaceae bacterium]
MLRQKSSGSVKIISIDRDQALARLRQIAARLCLLPEVAEVRLFGSLARGDQTGTSDADILVVLQSESKPDYTERVRSYSRYFDLPIGVDLLLLTQAEITCRLQENEAWMQRVWQESLPLCSSADS